MNITCASRDSWLGGAGKGWRPGASVQRLDCALWTQFCRARTSRGLSHYDLLQAFADKAVLRCADEALERAGYRTHEFGDSVLIERDSRRYSHGTPRTAAAEIFPEMQGLVERAAPRILRRFAPAPAYVVQESHCLSPAR